VSESTEPPPLHRAAPGAGGGAGVQHCSARDGHLASQSESSAADTALIRYRRGDAHGWRRINARVGSTPTVAFPPVTPLTCRSRPLVLVGHSGGEILPWPRSGDLRGRCDDTPTEQEWRRGRDGHLALSPIEPGRPPIRVTVLLRDARSMVRVTPEWIMPTACSPTTPLTACPAMLVVLVSVAVNGLVPPVCIARHCGYRYADLGRKNGAMSLRVQSGGVGPDTALMSRSRAKARSRVPCRCSGGMCPQSCFPPATPLTCQVGRVGRVGNVAVNA